VARVAGAGEISPTARALLALEAIQSTPGITAQRLGERLGVTERATRRYIAILREATEPAPLRDALAELGRRLLAAGGTDAISAD